MKKGTLYIIATPIGNLGDITRRAVECLELAGAIAAEDTRRTRKLLSHLGISRRMISYREHNRRSATERIIQDLKNNIDVALVTDAGTPGVSDPGHYLVRSCIEEGIDVTPIPGPSALTTALCASGMEVNSFFFQGFLPSRQSARRKKLAELAISGYPMILYESPKRVKSTLEDIADIMEDRDIVIAREMTKLHEEFIRGNATDVLKTVAEKEFKGEITIIIGEGIRSALDLDITDAVKKLKAAGLSASRTASVLAGITGIDRKTIYSVAANIKKEEENNG